MLAPRSQENSFPAVLVDTKLEGKQAEGSSQTFDPGGSVRVLVTADTFSGVWTYSRELVSGLVTQGAQVMLVSFGEIPLPDQTAWMHGPAWPRISSHRVSPRLDAGRRAGFLCGAGISLRDRARHASGYSPPQSAEFWRAAGATPRVVIAHGDVITWWLTIHGQEPAAFGVA